MARVLLLLLVLLGGGRAAEPVVFHYNDTYKFDVAYTVLVSKANEYILEFGGDEERYDTPARVTVASEHANRTYPVFITARQQKGVLTWQLPTTVATPGGVEEFSNISRTLCPHNNLFLEDAESCVMPSINTPIIHLSTSSPDDILVHILVSTVKDFYVKLNTEINTASIESLNHTYSFQISPSEPTYYFFSFQQEDNLDLDVVKAQNKLMCSQELTPGERGKLRSSNGMRGVDGGPESDWLMKGGGKEGNDWFSRPKSAILLIESDDDICAVVSIQNFSCPVFDNERDILYDGYYLTMMRRGGITLTQETYPLGFYIVFIVKSSDGDCLEKATTGTSNLTTGIESYLNWHARETVEIITNDGRSKTFRFAVVATISYQEYIIAASIVFAFFLSFYFVYLAAILFVKRKKSAGTPADGAGNDGYEENLIAPSVPHDESSTSVMVTGSRPNIQDVGAQREGVASPGTVTECSSSSDSDADSEFSTLADAETEKDIYRLPKRLCVASLARKKPRVLRARSNLYLWNVLTVAVFYTLPVVQLVITYQRLLRQSGNQDLCYYNFLCAHPLGLLSDINHVYSNLGYVMLGILFLLQVFRRQRNSRSEQSERGIPQHYGLLYAMGLSLISEGLLSGSYHVCPNDMNFQFDTSFMYVTAVLCMVKIYQCRHPDINARAHATFGVLALIIFIGLVGVLNASVYFWIFFTILHLTSCFLLTFQIYYMGRFRFDAGLLCRAGRELVSTPLAAVTPTYCGRMVLLILANLTNWVLAGYGMYQHQRDFASHLLIILMGNLFLYTNFYIVMKLLHRETIKPHSWMFVVLTHTCWFTGAYFFLHQSTSWALTPAQSRQYNEMCELLKFFDRHDIWHFLSAVAMFFSFNMYLTIDDGLSDIPRNNIMVF